MICFPRKRNGTHCLQRNASSFYPCELFNQVVTNPRVGGWNLSDVRVQVDACKNRCQTPKSSQQRCWLPLLRTCFASTASLSGSLIHAFYFVFWGALGLATRADAAADVTERSKGPWAHRQQPATTMLKMPTLFQLKASGCDAQAKHTPSALWNVCGKNRTNGRMKKE